MASTTHFVMAGLPLGTHDTPGNSHVTMTGPPGKRVVERIDSTLNDGNDSNGIPSFVTS